MLGYFFISALALAAVGLLLVTYVQIGIIRTRGMQKFAQRGLVNVYWRDRKSSERWCFFGGLSLLLGPFLALGLLALSRAAI